MFEYACELNKVELPKVMTFPSYFSIVNQSDSTGRYPYIVEKLSMNEGKVTNIQNEFSSNDQFLTQIESAILYSDIKQPKIKGKEIAADIYLMVSFFPQLSYPVAPYDAGVNDSSNLMHKYRIKIINKKSKLLSEPIPKRVPSNRYGRQLFDSFFMEAINVYIHIDTSGHASVMRVGTSNKKLSNSIRKLVTKLKFFPAIDQNDNLVDFQGYLRVEPYNETDVRISYLWMN